MKNTQNKLQTPTGRNFDLLKPCYSSLVKFLDHEDNAQCCKLAILEILGTRMGGHMELTTDLRVVDQFGYVHVITEDYIWQ